MFTVKPCRVGILKLCCDAVVNLSVADLQKDAILADGHHFIKTRFAVRTRRGHFILYFCRCGEMAFESDTALHTMRCLTNDGCEQELHHCSLPGTAPATAKFVS